MLICLVVNSVNQVADVARMHVCSVIWSSNSYSTSSLLSAASINLTLFHLPARNWIVPRMLMCVYGGICR